MTPPITPAGSDTAPLRGTARQELFSSGLSCDRKKEHILCTGEEEEVYSQPAQAQGVLRLPPGVWR